MMCANKLKIPYKFRDAACNEAREPRSDTVHSILNDFVTSAADVPSSMFAAWAQLPCSIPASLGSLSARKSVPEHGSDANSLLTRRGVVPPPPVKVVACLMIATLIDWPLQTVSNVRSV